MRVPTPPTLTALDRVTPTLYEALLKCSARAAWIASNDRSSVPVHPKALLGLGVHSVLEKARAGGLQGGSDEEIREQAGMFFEERIADLLAKAHPLLRVKFESPERLPFYYLLQARCAQMAFEITKHATKRQSSRPRVPHVPLGPRGSVETLITSVDGRLAGRPDFLDSESRSVVDYKFGISAEGGQISESEARQLRLYAFLAEENGTSVEKGVIERGDRTRLELRISREDALEEGKNARRTLEEFNARAGSKFEEVASPTPQNCQFCPCIPFCEAFWSKSEPNWSQECGTHLEGVVTSVDEGAELIAIHLHVTKGTATQGEAVVTRLSREWLAFDGSPVPTGGQTIRVTDTTYVADTDNPAAYRADRITTAVWLVPSEELL